MMCQLLKYAKNLFLLGPVGPRAVGWGGGGKRTIGERFNDAKYFLRGFNFFCTVLMQNMSYCPTYLFHDIQ
jgi:hypothetical protein